ncbi:MAG: hypothetical protein N2690_12455, partial [Rhodocyclaceae bacterium]|nr:hypothetical protein [Rhodocyclaceae bacterium]
MAKPSRRQLLDRVDFAALVHPTFVHLRRMLTPRLKPLLLPLTRALGHLTKRDRTAWILISRADIWPPNHGAAVKIERTAWGLSFVVDRVYLLSDDRSRYHEVQQGRFRERRYPAWLQRLGPDPKRVRAWVLAQGIPASDAFLYEPAVDWGLIART